MDRQCGNDKDQRADVGSRIAELVGFGRAFYGSLTAWADALFELCGVALVCTGAGRLGAVVELGAGVPPQPRQPVQVARQRQGRHRPAPVGPYRSPAGRLAAGVRGRRVDLGPLRRGDDPRAGYYSASKHSAGQPIVAGWSYQWITQLDWAPDSCTAPLDAQRIAPSEDTVAATITGVHRLVGRLGDDGPVPLFVFDAGYDGVALGAGLTDTRAQVLVRIPSDRVSHPDPDPKPAGAVGRPRRHGARSDAASRPEPDACLSTHDPRYGYVRVEAWHSLHPKLQGRGRWAGHDAPPIVRGTVIRVAVEHLPKATARAVKTLWLWWSGPGTPDPDVCWRAYLRRFDIEQPTGSRRARSCGPPRRCAPPNRPTAGPGSSPPTRG